MSNLIQEINRLISKGMYVLLIDVFNGCIVQLCKTFTIKKNQRSQNFDFIRKKI